MRWLIAISLLLSCWVLPATAQTGFDQYGGLSSVLCTPGGTSPNTYYNLVKINNRWWFCTPAGHAEFSTQVNVQESNSANNTGHAGGASGRDCQTNTVNSLGSTLSWTNQGPTYPNTYLANINFSGGGAAWTPYQAFQDGIGMCCGGPGVGTQLVQETSIASVDATVSSYYYDGAGNLYVHTSTGDSPAAHTNMNFPQDSYYVPLHTKYADPLYDAAWQTEKRMQHWGFNSLGQDSFQPSIYYDATCSSCDWPLVGSTRTNPIPLPMILEMRPIQHSANNLNGYANSPVKSLSAGDDTNYGATYKNWTVDAFDPNLALYFQKYLGTESGDPTRIKTNNPHVQGWFTDDSDQFTGSGAGPDFIAGTHNNPNPARIALITAPQQYYSAQTSYNSGVVLYTDPKVYTKTQANNPSTCSISAPCSIRDYLAVEYSDTNGPNISLLNAAWGSNYTTFDSSGVQVTNEVVSSTGTATSYTYQLKCGSSCSQAISPFSIGIFVGGVLKAGDCPSWFHSSGNGASFQCKVRTSSGSGSIESPTSGYLTSASNINYATGVLNLTFGVAPNAQITVNYVYGGWAAGGTGLMDEDGTNPWVGAQAFCLEGANPSYPNSYVCSQSGGYYQGLPNEAFQIASPGIVVSGATTNVTITPATNTTYTLANGQSVYISGSSVAACNGGPYTISDGGTTSTSFSITTPTNCTSATGGWVNSAVAHDLDNWIVDYSAEYHKIIRDNTKAANNPYLTADVKVPWLGLDDVGSWYEPAISYFYLGAAPYVDALEMGGFDTTLPSPSDSVNVWKYITQYLGDKPILNQAQYEDTPDSPSSCHGEFTSYGAATSQADRGTRYYNAMNFLLNTQSYNGTYQFVGMDFWYWNDFGNYNQGLTTLHDNAYDGVEDVTGYSAAACENTANGGYYVTTAGYKCGGEEANFGNMLTGTTGVVAANQLWIQAANPGAAQFSASPNPIAFGNVNVNSTSAAQTETLTNLASTGGSTLNIGQITAPSPLTIGTDNCSNVNVVPQGTCTFQLTVTPTTAGTGSATVTIPDNAGNPDSVGATWTGVQMITTYTLTAAKNGNGAGTVTSTDSNINCGATCSASYNAGSQATLSASPATGSAFTGWSGGGCSGTGSCAVTVNVNTTVTATFSTTTPHGKSRKMVF